MKTLLLPSKILVVKSCKNMTSEIWKHNIVNTKGETREAEGEEKQNYPQHPLLLPWEILCSEHLLTIRLYPVSNLANQINNYKKQKVYMWKTLRNILCVRHKKNPNKPKPNKTKKKPNWKKSW